MTANTLDTSYLQFQAEMSSSSTFPSLPTWKTNEKSMVVTEVQRLSFVGSFFRGVLLASVSDQDSTPNVLRVCLCKHPLTGKFYSKAITMPPIRSRKAPDLTRDQKRDCQLRRSLGWTHKAISRHTRCTLRQAQRAPPTLKKKSGRLPILTQAQVGKLVEFVCASAKNRRMSYEQLAKELEFGAKKDAIRNALMKEGYHRRLAMREPPISEKNRATRLAWALKHRDWTMEQWYEIHRQDVGYWWTAYTDVGCPTSWRRMGARLCY